MRGKLYEKDKICTLISPLRTIKKHKTYFIIVLSLIVISIISIYFTSRNEIYYKKTIAKITAINEEKSSTRDFNGNEEQIKKQTVKAIIMNGSYKEKEIQFENTTSFSGVKDLNLKINDEVFVSIQTNGNKEITSSKLLDYKRDKYIVYIATLFILLITLIGGIKGLKSLTSVIINILIFSVVIQLFLKGYNLILISIIASILFILLSISIVCGINKKSLSAIMGTMVATLISMLIAVAVILLNNWNGVHFEEMEFLTRQPKQIFIIELLIGTIGGVMDIAISISSSIKEITDRNPCIERKNLINSGREIGKDIMGTMANTLLLAYISGSIPIILLLLRNQYPISVIIDFNLSLEILRALTGSIGVVISIPISIFISVLLFGKHKIGEV